MKPVGVKDNTYIDFKKEVINKDPKFKVGDHVRISKYKIVFALHKKYTHRTGLKKFLQLRTLQIQFLGNMLLTI